MMIEQLHLQNFKGFKDFTLECSNFVTLVGGNSSGKTTILQAIKFLHDVIAGREFTGRIDHLCQRISASDPAAFWFGKADNEPCNIEAKFSGDVSVRLIVKRQHQFELFITRGNATLGPTKAPRDLEESEWQGTLSQLRAIQPLFVPPVGILRPLENWQQYRQIQGTLENERYSDCWRGNLFWVSESHKERLGEITGLIAKCLPGLRALPPEVSREDDAKIHVDFEENGVRFDIGIGGGGLRTLYALVAMLKLSDSRCFLFDEPDSHLHSSLQREVARMMVEHAEETGVQIFVATHAPDLIAEVPPESLVWIDRTAPKGRRCSEIGRVLLDLGAISNADAIRAYGADKILFVEGNGDRKILKALLHLCGGDCLFDEKSILAGTLPCGKGDRGYLRAYQDMLLDTLKTQVRIACIADRDYEIGDPPKDDGAKEGGPLHRTLGRKEIENYLLEPEVILAAIRTALQEIRNQGKKPPEPPTIEDVRAQLNTFIGSFREHLMCQLKPRYRKQLPSPDDEATKEKKANDWFEKMWQDERWRMCYCPGKDVLPLIRHWAQRTYHITLAPDQLVAALEKAPEDIESIGKSLKEYFKVGL